MEHMHPIVTFYRPFAPIATFFSLFTCYLFLRWGSVYYVLTLFWIKAFSSALLGGVFHMGRPDQLHFYHNLGFSTLRLYAMAALLDLLLWASMLFITGQFV